MADVGASAGGATWLGMILPLLSHVYKDIMPGTDEHGEAARPIEFCP